ncbi:hypothetical protein PFLUOLIPICF7_19120 [Pseudomonas simiae]|nr:hypothetical protein PFLUOLIPICF7_19120 [Pseudomonas simiae]
MPPSTHECTEGLATLRIRPTIATSAMYAMIGKEQPVQDVRFQIVNKTTGAYHVVERSTGKVMGMCFTWPRSTALKCWRLAPTAIRSTSKRGRSDERYLVKRIRNQLRHAGGRHGLICKHMN